MKLYKKIDIYFKGQYIASTNLSRTCKDAKTKFLEIYEKYNIDIHRAIRNEPDKLKTYFDRNSK